MHEHTMETAKFINFQSINRPRFPLPTIVQIVYHTSCAMITIYLFDDTIVWFQSFQLCSGKQFIPYESKDPPFK